MTEKQLELFNRYQHIVPEKIAKYAPRYVNDEDFKQDAFVHLIEHIISNSTVFEKSSKSVVVTSIHNTMNQYIVAHCKRLQKFSCVTCSYDDVADVVDSSNPFSVVNNSMANYYIAKAMSSLNAREQLILAIRFGFLGRTVSLSDTGEVFGLSQERIRQLENKAIRKLRHPSRKKYIVDFWE